MQGSITVDQQKDKIEVLLGQKSFNQKFFWFGQIADAQSEPLV